MARYKKRPVVIEAFQWFNHTELNETPEWFRKAIENGTVQLNYDGTITIETFEGPHLSREGDYIIQGVKGEIYPCKPDIFEMTYEPEGSTGSITVDRERNTASGVFRVERGGGHIGGKMVATLELQDMTPLDLSNINELTGSLAKDIIYRISAYAISQ